MARMEAVLLTGLWRGTLLMVGLWGWLNNRWDWVVGGGWWVVNYSLCAICAPSRPLGSPFRRLPEHASPSNSVNHTLSPR